MKEMIVFGVGSAMSAVLGHPSRSSSPRRAAVLCALAPDSTTEKQGVTLTPCSSTKEGCPGKGLVTRDMGTTAGNVHA